MSNPDERVFVIRGGQGASKTVSIIELIIQSLMSSEKEATVLSSELSKMKRTVIRDYKKICKDWGVIQNETDFNKSESKHEYPNGSYIDFLGADTSDLGKGFRRDILYINEADKMDIETAVQFISRAALTIIDYNPDKLFWGDDYINEHNFITLTFEDNEYLADTEVQSILEYKTKGFHDPTIEGDALFKESNIKDSYWANKWKVYGCGLVGALHGVVFSNWEDCETVPEHARFLGSGLDFGFSNDPTALTDIYEADGWTYLDERIYETGLTNPDIARLCKSMNIGQTKNHMIYADSAEPKSIKELKDLKLHITEADKGPDSIDFGIQKMQERKFRITKRSKNVRLEFTKYRWATDKAGNSLNVPEDAFNHAIDGVRYFFQTTKKRGTKPKARF